jgi:GT2 family glycosyltransferase
LVCSDPDVAAHEDWLENLLAAFNEGVQMAVGAMGVREQSWWECGVHLAKFHELLPGLPRGRRSIAPTANAFYSRDLWRIIGPFPEDVFAGDAIMSWRATHAGHEPRFLPEAVVDHVHGGGWRQLWRERTSRGREFLLERSKSEKWPAERNFAYLMAVPLLPALVLWRTFQAAWQSGWTGRYFMTLPIQLWAQIGWTLGEARGVMEAMRRRNS